MPNMALGNTSMLTKTVALLIAALAVSGCDGMSRAQLLVKPPSHAAQARFVISGSERENVRAVLLSVAAELKFDEGDPSKSPVPNTIAWFKEHVDYFEVSFGARVVGDTIVVDIEQFHPGASDPPTFQRVKEALRVRLTENFGERVTEPSRENWVPF